MSSQKLYLQLIDAIGFCFNVHTRNFVSRLLNVYGFCYYILSLLFLSSAMTHFIIPAIDMMRWRARFFLSNNKKYVFIFPFINATQYVNLTSRVIITFIRCDRALSTTPSIVRNISRQ